MFKGRHIFVFGKIKYGFIMFYLRKFEYICGRFGLFRDKNENT